MAKTGKKESAAQKRQRRQLNHKVHEQAVYIWLSAAAILVCIFWVVYYVASRPKKTAADDEGRKALQDAVEQLLATTSKTAGDSQAE